MNIHSWFNHSFIYYSCIAESKDFHSQNAASENPFLYCILQVEDDKVSSVKICVDFEFKVECCLREFTLQPLSCPPAMSFHVLANQTSQVAVKYLLRGDSKGRVHIWDVPNITANQLAQLQQDMFDRPPSGFLSVAFCHFSRESYI